MEKSKHLGSSFDSFLESEGILEEVEAVAIKRVLAAEVSQYLDLNQVKKTVFARRINTSRSQLDRLLDSENPSVTLQTMVKAARGIGKKLELKLAS
ncbi:putative XRE-type DNA-binding protein [Zhongshania antarctica]|uniref:Putative XRE-type DNA-binding protein n=1 Tax=Zhongshania antarctica TaxID=641702 RepID=A0A840R7L8_9GAMM|nr:XRE family transcriptional regulator [Zhongshania antarctica]MBB5189255.1 putative XRE-type DNA-binding protein [Zhongshania antarctica]